MLIRCGEDNSADSKGYSLYDVRMLIAHLLTDEFRDSVRTQISTLESVG